MPAEVMTECPHCHHRIQNPADHRDGICQRPVGDEYSIAATLAREVKEVEGW